MNLQNETRTKCGSKRKHSPNGAVSGMVLLWAAVCIPTPSMGEASFNSLIACSELVADAERLACFDREMGEIKKNSPQPRTRAAPTPEEQFGLSSKQVLGPTPKALHAHIASVSQSAYERQTFVLDNTQTWQQTEFDPDFAVGNGQEVAISNGALGSFWLSTDSRHRTRVKRIR